MNLLLVTYTNNQLNSIFHSMAVQVVCVLSPAASTKLCIVFQVVGAIEII